MLLIIALAACDRWSDQKVSVTTRNTKAKVSLISDLPDHDSSGCRPPSLCLAVANIWPSEATKAKVILMGKEWWSGSLQALKLINTSGHLLKHNALVILIMTLTQTICPVNSLPPSPLSFFPPNNAGAKGTHAVREHIALPS